MIKTKRLKIKFIIGILVFFSINSILFNLNLHNANNLEKKSQEIITPKSSGSTSLWVHTAGDSIEAVAISANGDYIVSGGRDNNVYLFNKSSSTPIWNYSLPSMIHEDSLAISADGSYIIAGAYWDGIFFFNRTSPIPIWNFTTDPGIRCVDISVDGNYIAVGASNTLYLFNRSIPVPIWTNTSDGTVTSVAISSEGTYIAAVQGGNSFCLYNNSSPIPIWKYTLTGFQPVPLAMDISVDGNYIVGGSLNHHVYFFNKSSPIPMWDFDMGTTVSSVAISPDGGTIAAISTGSVEAKLCVFNRSSSTPLWNFSAENPGMNRDVAISSDGSYIAFSHKESIPNAKSSIYFFEKSSSTPIWSFTDTGNYPDIQSIALSSDGSLLAAGTQNTNSTYLFNLIPGSFNLSSDAKDPDPDGSFNLTWSISDYADNYSIYVHNNFISEINGSVTLLDIGITDLNYSISGLTNGIYYYKVVAFNDVGNQSSNCIYIDVQIAPQINFQPTLEYLNTTEPMETDLSLEINCTATNSTALQWVYLCENSTGIFVNRSMNLGINNEWTYVVDISALQRGDRLPFLFYANDLYYIRKNDNNNLNFSLFIGDVYPPSSNVQFNISHIPNFVSKSTLFNITTLDVGERPSGILNFSYKIDLGAWKEYNNPFNLSNLDEGMHTIYYNATDNIGNVEDTNQITVYLDLNNITSFLNFTYYEDLGIKYISNFIEFSIDWNDGMGSGLQILCYKIDSGSYIAFNISFTLSGYSEGLHNISIYSVDNVGNIEPEKVIEIYLEIFEYAS